MNNEELIEQLNSLKKSLQHLTTIVKSLVDNEDDTSVKTVDKPREGDTYYCLNFHGDVVKDEWYNSHYDNVKFEQGNYFKTFAEAELYNTRCIVRRKFEQYIKAHDKGSINNAKYTVIFDNRDKTFGVARSFAIYENGAIYASNAQVLRDAMNYIGKENLKYLFNIDDEETKDNDE